MKLVVGQVKIVKLPRAVGETSGLRQMRSLEAWAALHKPRQLITVRADRREQGLEGFYWLAVLRGKPFWPTEETLHCTNRIEAGWLVVDAQGLRLQDSECEGGLRSYSRCWTPRRSSSSTTRSAYRA